MNAVNTFNLGTNLFIKNRKVANIYKIIPFNLISTQQSPQAKVKTNFVYFFSVLQNYWTDENLKRLKYIFSLSVEIKCPLFSSVTHFNSNYRKYCNISKKLKDFEGGFIKRNTCKLCVIHKIYNRKVQKELAKLSSTTVATKCNPILARHPIEVYDEQRLLLYTSFVSSLFH